MADNQSIIGRGAIFKGKISNASIMKSMEEWMQILNLIKLL